MEEMRNRGNKEMQEVVSMLSHREVANAIYHK